MFVKRLIIAIVGFALLAVVVFGTRFYQFGQMAKKRVTPPPPTISAETVKAMRVLIARNSDARKVNFIF